MAIYYVMGSLTLAEILGNGVSDVDSSSDSLGVGWVHMMV